MRKINFIIFILFLAFGIHCRQKYEIIYTSAQTFTLVVEGFVNTAGVTKINLSRTTLLSGKGAPCENDATLAERCVDCRFRNAHIKPAFWPQ